MKLLNIGQFAQLTGLNVTALRFYDGSGLLPAAQVNPETGYRSYAPAQLPLGLKLAALRCLQLPLSDLAELLHAPPTEAAALIEHHERRLLEAFQSRRALLLGTLPLLQTEHVLPDVPVTYDCWPEQPIISRVLNAEAGHFGDSYERCLQQLRACAADAGAEASGPDFGLYHPQDFLSGVQAEVCLPLRTPARSQGTVRASVLPATPVACALHAGGWRTFSATYSALYLTITAGGHQPGPAYTRAQPGGTELGFLLLGAQDGSYAS